LNPTGLVNWSSDGQGRFSGRACKLSKGSCFVKYTPLSSSSAVNITARYAGDKHNPPSAETFSLSVVKKASTLGLSCSARSVVAGSSKAVTCTAHVKGYLPKGNVSWSQSGTGTFALGSGTCLLIKGVCAIRMRGVTAGTVTIQAAFDGDSNNIGNRSCRTLTVSSPVPGSPASLTTVATSSGNCPAGTVTIVTATSTTAASSADTATDATTTPTAGQAFALVVPSFEGNPTATQSVSVFIDGQDVGSASSGSPLISVLSPGSHTVSCSDVSGYRPLGATTFTISAGEEALVTCIYVPTSTAVTSTSTSTATSAVTTSSAPSTTTTTTYVTTSTAISTSSLVNGIPDPSFHNGTADISYPADSAALTSYALGLINTDRAANGLPPVSLSSVPSGQQHADSMLYFGYFSHYDPQGYSPYQRYTMLGGRGTLGENIGFAACTSSPANTTGGLVPQPCNTSTVDNGVAVLEWSMMNNDVLCCGNGHRDNILNPLFTTVSIGIAYSGSAVYFVEDFGTV